MAISKQVFEDIPAANTQVINVPQHMPNHVIQIIGTGGTATGTIAINGALDTPSGYQASGNSWDAAAPALITLTGGFDSLQLVPNTLAHTTYTVIIVSSH